MSFAAFIDRANAAVFRRLADSPAVLDHVEVAGIFDNGMADSLTMAAQAPTFLLPSAACTRTAHGSKLRIPDLGNDGVFTVQAIEPDGTGLTLLKLQKARAE